VFDFNVTRRVSNDFLQKDIDYSEDIRDSVLSSLRAWKEHNMTPEEIEARRNTIRKKQTVKDEL